MRTVNNNCFIALYDYQKSKYFYRRCEPIVASKSKSFMILDSIFSKIITVYKDEQDLSWYKIFSRRLDNYGQAFDTLSPFLLAKEFGHFLHCQHKSAMTSYLATEVAHMNANEDLQHKQLIISKKFSNIARRDETILVWNDFTTARPTEITDKHNKVAQLSLINASFLQRQDLLSAVREQREEQDEVSLSYLTMLPEMSAKKTRAGPIQTMKTMKKLKTIREKYTRDIVQIESASAKAIRFVQENGYLKVHETSDNLKVNRFRRSTSLYNPTFDADKSRDAMLSQISSYDQSLLMLDKSAA